MIKFEDISQREFDIFYMKITNEYAEEIFANGSNFGKSELLELSSSVISDLLPNGLDTKGNFIQNIINEGKKIGQIWYTLMGKPDWSSVLCFLNIDESARGNGYAKQSLSYYESVIQNMGGDTLALGVFKNNKVAYKLYEKFGFEIIKPLSAVPGDKPTKYKMSKRISK